MKKLILAAGLLIPLAASALKVSSVSMTNYPEPAYFAGLGYVSVVVQNLSVDSEIFLSFTFKDDTDTEEPLTTVAHSQDAQIYTAGNMIIIKSTPNARYTITSIVGVTLYSGVLDSNGTAEIATDLAQGIYAVSINKSVAEQVVVK